MDCIKCVIVSFEFVVKVREVGVEMRFKKMWIGLFINKSFEGVKKLGFCEMQQVFSEFVGRDVDFMIFESEEVVIVRGFSIVVLKE